jgi:hypothetical protein
VNLWSVTVKGNRALRARIKISDWSDEQDGSQMRYAPHCKVANQEMILQCAAYEGKLYEQEAPGEPSDSSSILFRNSLCITAAQHVLYSSVFCSGLDSRRKDYSCLKATMGSTLTARRAGM